MKFDYKQYCAIELGWHASRWNPSSQNGPILSLDIKSSCQSGILLKVILFCFGRRKCQWYISSCQFNFYFKTDHALTIVSDFMEQNTLLSVALCTTHPRQVARLETRLRCMTSYSSTLFRDSCNHLQPVSGDWNPTDVWATSSPTPSTLLTWRSVRSLIVSTLPTSREDESDKQMLMQLRSLRQPVVDYLLHFLNIYIYIYILIYIHIYIYIYIYPTSNRVFPLTFRSVHTDVRTYGRTRNTSWQHRSTL